MPAATIRHAHAVHPIAAVQVEYSLFKLDIEKLDILKTACELGISIVAYSPLRRGLLTGRYVCTHWTVTIHHTDRMPRNLRTTSRPLNS